jgi:hypothetical protein
VLWDSFTLIDDATLKVRFEEVFRNAPVNFAMPVHIAVTVVSYLIDIFRSRYDKTTLPFIILIWLF